MEDQNKYDQAQDQHPTPETEPESAMMPEQGDSAHNKNANLLIVVVLAVIVVILALMYLWGQATSELPSTPPPPPEALPVNDDINALEQDLAAPDLESLGSEVDALEAELDVELQQL